MSHTPLDRARIAFDGLSVGDAFGQCVFRQSDAPDAIARARRLPPGPWRYSDDTEMGAAVLEVLAAHERVEQDALAAAFARRYAARPDRGYGAVAVWILSQLTAGRAWREVAREPYDGQGSMGNGAAMRVAPVGGYFATDLREVAAQARASAEVTHAHPEGAAGAVAVAVAGALAWRGRRDARATGGGLLAAVLAHVPPGETARRLREAAALRGATPERAAAALGDGTEVTAPDTVPFALWCAARQLDRYDHALWLAAAGLTGPGADRDTVCAIVGGVVALATGGPPAAWLARREPLPEA